MGSHPSRIVTCAILLFASLIVAAPAVAASSASQVEGAVAIVHGTITENAAAVKAVADSKVTIAGLPATVEGQTFRVTGVPVGRQPMVVSAPRHVTLRQQVEVLPGDATVDVALGITVVETCKRCFAAFNSGRFARAYRMVHPDVRAHYTLNKYAASIRPFIPYRGMRILRVRTLASWRPAYLNTTYHGIKAIRRALLYKCGDDVCSELGTRYWHRIDGRWYYFFDWRK